MTRSRRSTRLLLVLLVLACATAVPAAARGKKKAPAEEKKKPDVMSAETFAGLELRGLGPAIASGRIGDVVVDPTDRSRWFVAAASGGVWKTTDAGTSWAPVFDGQGSYSIGCLALDPRDPLTLWVGTGENNSQRSVGYGDGVYKTVDGGVTWKNVGLPESEHIGKIVVDPRDSRVVYVAAQGPLWRSGGDRGLYKTTDGGATWQKVLAISDDTGVTDLVVDPRDPDVLLAAAYQRRRHVWTLIDGGPESALYKSRDGGATWAKITRGLPEKVDLGRIGLAAAPSDPDRVYAIVEAARDEGGVFRSTDGGETWEKRSDYVSSSPQYYQELVVDPLDADRVYSLDTFMQVSEDGGKSWHKVGGPAKHVDDHALWIDPADPRHLLGGCDGGLYESFDRGATWNFFANLPVTQFYRVAVDDATPFYDVYGGTQDNNTLGGPARTRSGHGITNRDWFVTVGGDGFETQVDPTDPDIVYSEAQYGGLVRHDRKNGEILDIQPQPAPGEALRWNWSAPLLISPHSQTRLYFGANKLFRSDDRGDTWREVSGDLSRQLDRNSLPVMGRVWSVEAVAKNASTSFYGNIVSITESPRVEGLLYVGTDDGLVQVSDDGGGAWRRQRALPRRARDELRLRPRGLAARRGHGVRGLRQPQARRLPPLPAGLPRPRAELDVDRGRPPRARLRLHRRRGPGRPRAALRGHRVRALLQPRRGLPLGAAQGGLPTVAVRDLEIQSRAGDLVVGTFGRGIYVLDDLSPLRGLTRETLAAATLFPVRPAPIYMESYELGFPGKGFQGTSFFTAPNPPFGAVFTYYLKEDLETRAEQRRKREIEPVTGEKESAEAKAGGVGYPTWDELRAEEREEEPAVLLTVTDPDGHVVRRLTGPTEAGFHRVAWDLRYPAPDPTVLEEPKERAPWETPPMGPLAAPGTYTVSLAKRVRGTVTPLGEARSFQTVPLGIAALPPGDLEELVAFEKKTARLQRAVLGSVEALHDAEERLDYLEKAYAATPAAEPSLRDRAVTLRDRLRDLDIVLEGDPVIRKHNEPTPAAIVDRVASVVYGHWTSTAAPTATHREAYQRAADAFATLLPELRRVIEEELPALERDMEAAGAPWTPGRLPVWQPEEPR